MPLLSSDELAQMIAAAGGGGGASPPPAAPSGPAAAPDDSSPGYFGAEVPAFTIPTDAEVAARKQAAELLAGQQRAMLAGADTSAGAPVEVRAAVGSENDQASRLATLQDTYKDAQPLPGTNNFVYTDPATGQRKTYEPIGWRVPTLGDVVSLGPEAAQTVGSLGGGLLGTPGGPAGIAVGSGVGAAAASEGYRQAVHSLLHTQDLRTPGDIATDAAVTGVVNAAVPFVGSEIAGPAIKTLLGGPGGSAAKTAADALADSGVAPGLPDVLQAGVATGSKSIQRVESAASQMPFGGRVPELDQATRAQIRDGVGEVADRATPSGTVPDPETFGSNVNDVATNIQNVREAEHQRLADAVSTEIGPNTRVSVQPFQDMRDGLMAWKNTAPQSNAAALDPAIGRLTKLTEDADENGTLPFSVLQNTRSAVGKEVDFAGGPQSAGIEQPALRDVYRQLGATMQGAARDAGPAAEKALADHDAEVATWKAPGGPGQAVAQISDPSKVNAATLLNWAKSTSPGVQTNLGHVFAQASPADADTLASGMINQLGLDAGGNFNLSKFTKDWDGLTDVAKGMMFRGAKAPLQDDLNNLSTVGKGVMDASGTRGFSNTAAVMLAINAITGVGGHLLAGEPGVAASTAITNMGLPWAAGRLLESRPLVNWMTRTMADSTSDAWGRATTQLGTVAEADPRLHDFVSQLRAKMAAQSAPR